jgi:hypothetical protein
MLMVGRVKCVIFHKLLEFIWQSANALSVTVRTYPNQKPWITGNIHTEQKCRVATFKERNSNPDAYKKSLYALRQTIKQTTRQ